MTPILVKAPAVEPMTLAEAKAWLRVDTTDEDAVVAALIVAARQRVERATRQALIAQTWRLVWDAWPSGDLPIPLTPFMSLVALRVYAANNVAAVIAPATYVVDPDPLGARVRFLSPPAAPGRVVAGVEAEVVVGYATAAAGLPAPLLHAVRLLVARWFARRGDGDEPDAGLPPDVEALVAPYRRARLA
ncbi:MAG TPA: head-tail connector protein [Beijerinckiaceae bacterium]|jgi:uncharacterized phiE125 gp8 family phage protein